MGRKEALLVRDDCDVRWEQVCLCLCSDEERDSADGLTTRCEILTGQVPHLWNTYSKLFDTFLYGNICNWVSKKSL